MQSYIVQHGRTVLDFPVRNNAELYDLAKAHFKCRSPDYVLVTEDGRVLENSVTAVEPRNGVETPFVLRESRLSKSLVDVFVTPAGNTVDIIGLGCDLQKGAICGYASVMNVRKTMELIAKGVRPAEIVERLPSYSSIMATIRGFKVVDGKLKRQALSRLSEKYGRGTFERIQAIARTPKIKGSDVTRMLSDLGCDIDDYEAIKSLSQPETEWSTRADLHRFNLYVERVVEGKDPKTIQEAKSYDDGRALEYVDYSIEEPGGITYVCTCAPPVEAAAGLLEERTARLTAAEEDRLEREHEFNCCSRIAFLRGVPIPLVRRRHDVGMELLPSLVLPYLQTGKYLAWISPQSQYGSNHWTAVIVFITRGQRLTATAALRSAYKGRLPIKNVAGQEPTVAAGPAGFSLGVYVIDSLHPGNVSLNKDDKRFLEMILDHDELLYGRCDTRSCSSGVPDALSGIGIAGGAGSSHHAADEEGVWKCPFCSETNIQNEENLWSNVCRLCLTPGGPTGGRQRKQLYRTKRLYFRG